MSMLDQIWDDVVGGAEWLKDVVFGEFVDDRPASAVAADMLVSFVPGVVIVTSARDLTAVILRMYKDPARREQVDEWILVIACVIPLAMEAIMTAAGALAAGVGAAVGALAGGPAGAALRAVTLLLTKASELLEPMLKFLRKFVKGDVLAFLREVKFAEYGDAIAKRFGAFVDALDTIVKRVLASLRKVEWFSGIERAIAKLEELERGFYAIQRSAIRKIPEAIGVLDARLQKALSEIAKPVEHPVKPGTSAPSPARAETKPAHVATMSNNPIGQAPGVEKPPALPPGTRPDTNLHPQSTGDKPPDPPEDQNSGGGGGRRGSLTLLNPSRLRPDEIATGQRLADQQGLHLTESTHEGEEFVDQNGKTYDAMGTPNAYKYWNQDKFFDSIDHHVNKSADYVALDTTGASDAQKDAINNYISGQNQDYQKKIIIVH